MSQQDDCDLNINCRLPKILKLLDFYTKYSPILSRSEF